MKLIAPVAGVDVSKRLSDMCILAPDNTIMSRKKIFHDSPSMERAVSELHHAKELYGIAPIVVMESTSHYTLDLISLLYFLNLYLTLLSWSTIIPNLV